MRAFWLGRNDFSLTKYDWLMQSKGGTSAVHDKVGLGCILDKVIHMLYKLHI